MIYFLHKCNKRNIRYRLTVFFLPIIKPASIADRSVTSPKTDIIQFQTSPKQ